MRRRFTLRPAPGMSLFAAIVGVIILFIGITVMAQSGGFHPFILLWVLLGLIIVGYHLINALSGQAPPTEVVEGEESEIPPAPPVRTVEDRLRQLEDLHSKQLISDTEYAQRRQEILKEI